jgi:hypothetical protein
MAMPTNQQGFGTCVGHAFAKAMVQGCWQKFAVPFDTNAVFSKIEDNCPCWDGSEPAQMCEEWNAARNAKGDPLFVSTQEKGDAWHITVKHMRLGNLDQAHAYMKKWNNALCLVAVIRTSKFGHGLHAVCVQTANDRDSGMMAVNSWGETQAMVEVNRENFEYAVLVDPELVMSQKGSRAPKHTKLYSDATMRDLDDMMKQSNLHNDDSNEDEDDGDEEGYNFASSSHQGRHKGRRCKDGSLDMRDPANKGYDKYNTR